MDPNRVFISYAHDDLPTVLRLVEVLEEDGLDLMWDRQLTPGARFNDQIRSFISHSHAVLALYTEHSKASPWFHQEIGYTVALGIPILPIAIGATPSGLIADRQAICLANDLHDVQDTLTAAVCDALIGVAQTSRALFECTEDNTRRAALLAEYAESVLALGRSGMVRQKASLTSFHLPDRGPRDPIWRHYFPRTPDDVLLFEYLQRERIALTELARSRGCRLLLDPTSALTRVYMKHGPESVALRVRGLLDFLRDEAIDVGVAIGADSQRNESMTIVGDWFSSEAVSSGAIRLLREAIFTRHTPTIRQQAKHFDQEFEDRLRDAGWSLQSSREEAVRYLGAFLEERPANPRVEPTRRGSRGRAAHS